ncbi:chemotaxis protein CheV [Pelobacter propionicus]|uniref:Response regulator receiver modulated CheW protein n=1 Tax=Pelobacter propionicus (strain DSM 2379 / NBRC 103807 / OttBd1) TaxID=338966 RepID=A1ARK0_PELPD|nr:chemotaxis protein [Pelobacter propionicus]ABK99970.1 response regulator receiver modulated CheW protein [Pelobacter propionicus DSM 2379]
MKSTLDEALQRTKLSQSNQMEMLTFRLTDDQLYGINVFKIIEIIECPKRIDRMPNSHPAVKGALDFRGKALAVIDLSEAVGLPTKDFRNEQAYIIICEYNRDLTAFIVHAPDTLLTRSWADIHKPEGVNAEALVAIAYADSGETILLLDIESILSNVVGIERDFSSVTVVEGEGAGRHVLIVDDSRAAIMLLQSLLDRIGFSHIAMTSADKALEYLEKEHGRVDLIISDIEMPGMDGFTFTRTLREKAGYEHLKVILHSSMSNPSNILKAEQAGANKFVAKFDPESLSEEIISLIEA